MRSFFAGSAVVAIFLSEVVVVLVSLKARVGRSRREVLSM